MLNREYLSAVKYPALVQFIVTFIVLCIYNPITVPVFVVSNLIPCAIGQFFSYGCCWALVLRKGKGQRQVWTNYIVWTIVLNIELVSEMFGMM